MNVLKAALKIKILNIPLLIINAPIATFIGHVNHFSSMLVKVQKDLLSPPTGRK